MIESLRRNLETRRMVYTPQLRDPTHGLLVDFLPHPKYESWQEILNEVTNAVLTLRAVMV